jgi:hypothetical protein
MENPKDWYRAINMLNPEDATPRVVGLEATLTTTTTSDTGSYQVPADKTFLILRVMGYHRFSLPNTEAAMAAALGTNIAPSERAYLKLQNCVFSLKDTERSETDIVKGSAPCLAAISPMVSGMPLEFSMSPIVIPGGNKVEATFTLKDTTALVIGASSVYGLLLTGVLLPRR